MSKKITDLASATSADIIPGGAERNAGTVILPIVDGDTTKKITPDELFKAVGNLGLTGSFGVSGSGIFTGSFNILGNLTHTGNSTFCNNITDQHLFSGHITSSGNISSSGTITSNIGTFTTLNATSINFALASSNFTHVTASGNILLVGDISGSSTSSLDVGGAVRFPGSNTSFASNNITLGSDASRIEAAGFFTTRLQTASHITASGNISSSGNLIGNNVIATDVAAIDISATDITASNDVKVIKHLILSQNTGGGSTGENGISFGSPASNVGYIYDGGSGDSKLNLGYNDSDILSLGPSVSGETITMTGNTRLIGNLTASANISASGHIQADTGSFTKLQLSFANDSSDFIVANNENSVSLKVNNIENVNFTNATTTFSQPITSSGNISSSGVIVGTLQVAGTEIDFTNLPTSDPGVSGRLFTQVGAQLGLGAITASIATKKFVFVSA